LVSPCFLCGAWKQQGGQRGDESSSRDEVETVPTIPVLDRIAAALGAELIVTIAPHAV
jgi:hypothetical protein